MPLTKKTFLLLVASSAFLGLAYFLNEFEVARSRSLQIQAAELAAVGRQLTELQSDIERYELARGQWGGTTGSVARHEKVAISSHFSLAELPRINDLLAHAYDADGFLLLQRFSLQWEETEGEAGRAAQASLALDLVGEKVFTH